MKIRHLKESLFSLVFAPVVALLFFFALAKMVEPGKTSFSLNQDDIRIDLSMKNRDTQVQDKVRELKPPEKKQAPPKSEKLPVQLTQQQTSHTAPPQLAINLPKFGGLAKLGGMSLGATGPESSGDSGPIPLVRIEPNYPRKAALENTEGFVVMTFDISPEGIVENIEVLEAKPPRLFEKSARQALLKWRYKPGMQNGVPYEQKDQRVRIDFKLSG